MLCGQIGWSPKLESINGRIVFDGSVVPPVGLLQEPIRPTIRSGGVVEVEVVGNKNEESHFVD